MTAQELTINNDKTFTIRVINTKLPKAIHAFSCKDDNQYMIVMNDSINPSLQDEALIHELLHIVKGDCDGITALDLEKLELKRHKESAALYSKFCLPDVYQR